MTTLEQALTDTFAGLADEAPHDLGLLSRVQAATSRRTRARRLSYVVSSLAAVALVAVGITAMPFGEARADRFTDPTGFLVDNRGAEQRLPFTPTYFPAGASRIPQLDVFPTHGEAKYLFGGPVVTIRYAESYGITRLSNETSVDGIQAFEQCNASVCVLEWYRHPGQHVEISADLPLAELHRIAEGLTDTPLVVKPTVVLGLLPAEGCHLNAPLPNGTTYNDVDGSAACPVSVEVVPKGGTVNAPSSGSHSVVASRARIGDYDGTLSELGDAAGARAFWYAVLDVPDGRKLVVTTPSDGRWDRDELDRFVRAIVLP
jgi:hypothetical protein